MNMNRLLLKRRLWVDGDVMGLAAATMASAMTAVTRARAGGGPPAEATAVCGAWPPFTFTLKPGEPAAGTSATSVPHQKKPHFDAADSTLVEKHTFARIRSIGGRHGRRAHCNVRSSSSYGLYTRTNARHRGPLHSAQSTCIKRLMRASRHTKLK